MTGASRSLALVRLDGDGHASWRRHDPELDEHAQPVYEPPMLGQTSIDAPADVDLGPFGALASRGNPHELTGHGAGGLQIVDDLVTAGDRALDRVAHVRERALEGPEALLDAISRRGDAGLRRVLDVVGRQQLVEKAEVALIDDLERNPLGRQLDLGSH